MSFLVICEILAHFVNTWIADNKYSLRNKENLLQPIQMQLPINQNLFLNFFTPFIKSISYFKRIEKKMNLRAYAFPK